MCKLMRALSGNEGSAQNDSSIGWHQVIQPHGTGCSKQSAECNSELVMITWRDRDFAHQLTSCVNTAALLRPPTTHPVMCVIYIRDNVPRAMASTRVPIPKSLLSCTPSAPSCESSVPEASSLSNSDNAILLHSRRATSTTTLQQTVGKDNARDMTSNLRVH